MITFLTWEILRPAYHDFQIELSSSVNASSHCQKFYGSCRARTGLSLLAAGSVISNLQWIIQTRLVSSSVRVFRSWRAVMFFVLFNKDSELGNNSFVLLFTGKIRSVFFSRLFGSLMFEGCDKETLSWNGFVFFFFFFEGVKFQKASCWMKGCFVVCCVSIHFRSYQSPRRYGSLSFICVQMFLEWVVRAQFCLIRWNPGLPILPEFTFVRRLFWRDNANVEKAAYYPMFWSKSETILCIWMDNNQLSQW